MQYGIVVQSYQNCSEFALVRPFRFFIILRILALKTIGVQRLDGCAQATLEI